jgi:glutamate decarboxylase
MLSLKADLEKLEEPVDFSVHDLSAKLRERSWIVPAYTLPPNADHITIMRIVVRQNFSRDMADLFVEDVKKAMPPCWRQRPRQL